MQGRSPSGHLAGRAAPFAISFAAPDRLPMSAPAPLAARLASLFPAFKALVYALLLLNILIFFMTDDALVPHKAVDQIGWVIILAGLEWDSRAARSASVIGWSLAIELVGYACALYALGHYIAEIDWLEIINASAWLLIALLLWLDILVPRIGASRPVGVMRALLYAATLVCAILFGVQGKLLDFYDSVLWIVCFFVIELNILRLSCSAG